MKNVLKKIVTEISNFLFPKFCEGCGKEGSYLCDKCLKEKIEIQEKVLCHVCKKEIENQSHFECQKRSNIENVFVCAKYSKFIENFIGDIKYEFYYAMIPDLAKICFKFLDNLKEWNEIKKGLNLTFVPIANIKMRKRGFNQSKLLAEKIAERYNLKILNLLKKSRNTRSQVGLSRRERLENVRESFEICKFDFCLDGSSIAIVDDVFTTGATMEECAKVLRKAGFKRVFGIVVARG